MTVLPVYPILDISIYHEEVKFPTSIAPAANPSPTQYWILASPSVTKESRSRPEDELSMRPAFIAA